MRLYETAWVQVEGVDAPVQVRKDRINPAAFNVGDHQYDIDGRALRHGSSAPRLTAMLSLQAAREAGLRQDYNRDVSFGL